MSDYLKELFIDEAKAVLFKGSIGSNASEDEVATDEEVGDVIDDVFNSETNEDSGDTSTDTGETEDDNIATDEEVGDVIEDVFG